MSRSYKKNPVSKDSSTYSKFCKKKSNKRVRRIPDIPNGNSYKKVWDSWDICDWRHYSTKKSFINRKKKYDNYFSLLVENGIKCYFYRFKSEAEVIEEWMKIYKRK